VNVVLMSMIALVRMILIRPLLQVDHVVVLVPLQSQAVGAAPEANGAGQPQTQQKPTPQPKGSSTMR
jgi:hypothetical protein